MHLDLLDWQMVAEAMDKCVVALVCLIFQLVAAAVAVMSPVAVVVAAQRAQSVAPEMIKALAAVEPEAHPILVVLLLPLSQMV